MINQILNSYWFLSIFILAPSVLTLIYKRKKDFFIFNTSYVASYLIGHSLKNITAISRPFKTNPQILGLTTNIPRGYSFPSLHSTLITVFAWAVATIAPPLSWIGFIITFLISLSRVYLGVHYYFDIVGGFLLGTFIFWISYAFFKPNKIFPISTDPKVRRKIFHLIYGLTLAFLIHYQIITSFQLGLTTLAFGGFVLISRYQKKPKFLNIVSYFERKPEPQYLGLGPLFFLISSFATTLIFKDYIAVTAIINLAIGDSVNALIGHLWYQPNIWQKITNKPLPKGKRIPPAIAATIATLTVTLYYVTPWQAIIGAITTFILEFSTPKIKGKKLDDNLLIPPISGFAMSLV